MGKCTNIAMYIIINSATGLNIHDLFSHNLLLNSKNKKNSRNKNEDKDNIYSEKKLVKTHINFQPNIQDLPISIDLNLDLNLSSSHSITSQLVLYRSKSKKTRLNVNRKLDISLHISTSNDLDLFI